MRLADAGTSMQVPPTGDQLCTAAAVLDELARAHSHAWSGEFAVVAPEDRRLAWAVAWIEPLSFLVPLGAAALASLLFGGWLGAIGYVLGPAAGVLAVYLTLLPFQIDPNALQARRLTRWRFVLAALQARTETLVVDLVPLVASAVCLVSALRLIYHGAAGGSFGALALTALLLPFTLGLWRSTDSMIASVSSALPVFILFGVCSGAALLRMKDHDPWALVVAAVLLFYAIGVWRSIPRAIASLSLLVATGVLFYVGVVSVFGPFGRVGGGFLYDDEGWDEYTFIAWGHTLLLAATSALLGIAARQESRRQAGKERSRIANAEPADPRQR